MVKIVAALNVSWWMTTLVYVVSVLAMFKTRLNEVLAISISVFMRFFLNVICTVTALCI